MSFFDDCDPIACALDAVDALGLNISKVGIFTRVWDGGDIGKGEAADSVSYLSPTPRVQSVKKNQSNELGGSIEKGDLVVKLLSKSIYKKSDINCESDLREKELYYYISEDLYEVISIEETIAYWNVTLRKAKKRKLFI